MLNVNIADHKGVFCVNNEAQLLVKNKQRQKREFSNKNIAKFNRCILSESWDYVYTSDTQGAYTEFQRVIDRHFENSFPMLTFTMTYKNRHPWMTVLLRKQITEKKKIISIYTLAA